MPKQVDKTPKAGPQSRNAYGDSHEFGLPNSSTSNLSEQEARAFTQTPAANSPYDDASTEDPYAPSARSYDGKALEGAEKAATEAPDNPDDSDDDEDENDESPGLYKDSPRKRRLKSLSLSRRGMLLAGGASGGLISIIVLLFTTLAPLKITSIMSNLSGLFFAPSMGAVNDQMTKMVARYFIDAVIPSYDNCRAAKITSDCTVSLKNGPGNPVYNMYRKWGDARIEQRLAAKGIKVEYNPYSRTWKLYGPGLPKDGTDVGSSGEGIEKQFTSTGDFNKALRATLDETMAQETRWRQVRMRLQVGALMERKYGSKWCLSVCGPRYRFADWTEGVKRAQIEKAADYYLSERVLQPRGKMAAVAVKCIIDSGCKPENTTANNSNDPARETTNGEPVSDIEIEGRKTLEELATQYGVKDVDELRKVYEQISETGFKRYTIDESLSKVLGKEAGEVASKRISNLIPVLGWINLASQVIDAANDAGPKVKKLAYITTAAAAVAAFDAYQTHANEMRQGAIDAAEVGSWNQTLEKKDDSQLSKKELAGGNTSAEQTPLYNNLLNGSNTGTSLSYLEGLLPEKAYAAASDRQSIADSSGNVCDNGKPVPSGQLVCAEEMPGQGSAAANSVREYLHKDIDFFGPFGVVSSPRLILFASDAWRSTLGQLFDLGDAILGGAVSAASATLDKGCDVAGTGVNLVPVYCQIKGSIDKLSPAIMSLLSDVLIPNPWGDETGGGRNLDMSAAGAAIQGKDSTDSIGGKVGTDQEIQTAINEQLSSEQYAFSQKPLFARMFDTSSSYSFVSRLAVSMPTNPIGSTQANAGTLLSAPFTAIFRSFGAVLSGPRAFAATPSAADPFNINPSVFPKNKIPSNPGKYWDEHNCGDTSENGPIARWQKAAEGASNTDPDTGMPVHKDVEPCLLIKVAARAGTAVFDTSVLTPDEQAILTNQNSDGTINTSSGDFPKGSAKDLANQLKPYVENKKIQCNFSPGCPDIINTASGKSIKGGDGCLVDALDPALLGMLLKLVQTDHSFILSALCSDHHNDGMNQHSGGHSADFNYIDGVFIGPNADAQWTGEKLQVVKKLSQDIASFMPKSTEFGQVQCHPKFSFLSGFKTYNDTCHHLHVRAGT